MNRSERGVFCVDCIADEILSFRPALELLAHKDQLDFPTLTYKAENRSGLVRKIKVWSSRKDYKYPILWLAAHGSEGGFYTDDPKGAGFQRMDLGTLADIAMEGRYDWSGCIAHFGACSTLASNNDMYRNFFQETSVQAISGYSKDIPWIESLAFELIYIRVLQEVMTNNEEPLYNNGGITSDIVDECRSRILDSRKCHGLIDALGFRMITASDFGPT